MSVMIFFFIVPDSNIEVDMDNKKLYVTSDKPAEELLETIQKTGKDTELVGPTN